MAAPFDPAKGDQSADASWKRNSNNIATLSAEELARRRREFDAQKEVARGLRESAA
jgi:D-proline reductase (dithiol) PrdB